MTAFENYGREASQLELEIVRKGIALGIDWGDTAAVDALAREALDFKPGLHSIDHDDLRQRARYELFGLANLMLKVMAESAQEQMLSHGGTAWKAFGGALWRAWQEKSGPT
jgi:hypothetical protein